MDLEKHFPEKLICLNWIEEYNSMVEAIWSEIVSLNINIFILNKIARFPFGTFNINFPSSIFWDTVFITQLEMCVLTIYRITIDKRKDVLTINGFINKINKNFINDEYRNEFEKKTKGLNIKCEDKIKNLREKIITLRHKVIAHLNKEQCKRGIDKFISEHKIDISDLEILRNAIVKVFDYICFRHKRGTLPLDYSDTIYSNTDIDRIFDALVKDSNVFKMPEDQPDYWPYHRENMSKNDIRIFNEYRIKFGRSPV